MSPIESSRGILRICQQNTEDPEVLVQAKKASNGSQEAGGLVQADLGGLLGTSADKCLARRKNMRDGCSRDLLNLFQGKGREDFDGGQTIDDCVFGSGRFRRSLALDLNGACGISERETIAAQCVPDALTHQG